MTFGTWNRIRSEGNLSAHAKENRRFCIHGRKKKKRNGRIARSKKRYDVFKRDEIKLFVAEALKSTV